MRSLLVGLVLVTAAAGPLGGQRSAPAFPRWQPQLASAAPTPPARLFPKAPDHRWEGLVVGAAFMGLVGATLGGASCDANEPCFWSTVKGVLFGATLGGVTGGLLGSLIKKPPPDSPDHP